MFRKKIFKSFISFFLLLVMLLNLISTISPIFIYADDEISTRQNSFLNFYSDESGMELNMDTMTAQDYYVLSVFMSNFYRPGETTLAELVNVKTDPDSSVAFTNFVSVLGRSGSEGFKNTLANIVSLIAEDTVNGLESGKCTLYTTMGGGRRASGLDFLWLMSKGVDLTTGELSSQKIYFENSSHIAFDFSAPAVKAAFQTVASFNPKLFLDANGLETLDALFLDAVGNVWGLDLKTTDEKTKFDSTSSLSGLVGSYGADKFYLILPACLNPATFSAGVTNQKDLKMPLMNAYTLASIVDIEAFSPNIENGPIPFYNIFSETGAYSSDRNSGLNIIGVQSLTPFLLNTGYWSESKKTGIYASDSWSKFSTQSDMRQDLANFLYNPANISINKSVSDGIGEYGTNTYIVFATNLDFITTYVESSQDNISAELKNRNIDIHTNAGYAFSVFENSSFKDALKNKEDKLLQQQKLILYLYSPTLLNFNQVSMSFYYEDAYKNTTPSNISEQYAQKMYQDLSAEELLLSKTGMRGLDLFFNDNVMPDTFEDGNYIGVTPQHIRNSYFTEKLLSELDSAGIPLNSIDLYREVKNGKSEGDTLSLIYNTGLLGDIFNNKLTFSKWRSALKSKIEIVGEKRYYADWHDPDKKDNKKDDGTYEVEAPYKYSPFIKGLTTIGTQDDGIAEVGVGRTVGLNERQITKHYESKRADLATDSKVLDVSYSTSIPYRMRNILLTQFAYSIFGPSDVLTQTLKSGINFQEYYSGTLLGNSSATYKSTIKLYKFANQAFTMGIYFGYIVDMMGIKTCDAEKGLEFNSFGSVFLPKYDISSKGGSMSFSDTNSEGSGVVVSEDTSFEEKQKDLINRIYGLTNDSNNDYRNNLIKNIIEGVILTLHRTITGTWGKAVGSIAAGENSTYQSLTGYIYTPILEELPFTATLMNNYIKIYIVCLMLISFLLILMVMLHMRSWQQGVFTFVAMSVILLFPYILISNTINISNKIADNIYSDRFDFWAMSEYQERLSSLTGIEAMNEADALIALSNASADLTYTGTPGVKVKWMSPKKVEMFQQMYGDKTLSESFVVNTQIFKWLFSTFIYDSEFVDTDAYGSYLYRPFNSIALEADAYYSWGKSLMDTSGYTSSTSLNYNSYTFSGVPVGLSDSLSILATDSKYDSCFSYSLGRIDNEYLQNTMSTWTDKRMEDINRVSALDIKGVREDANKIGAWGMMTTTVSDAIVSDPTSTFLPGVSSNLPSDTDKEHFEGKPIDDISVALFLKNTESPFYYFYSVLKYRYQENSDTGYFKKELLKNELFKISYDENNYLDRSARGAYRDFLDLEGLFTYVIPYLHSANNYVIDWQNINGSEIEEFNFKYEVNESGQVTSVEDDGSIGYSDAVTKKNNMNRVWNMYSPWVDSLYGLKKTTEHITIGNKSFYVRDTLNPTSYLEAGRSMIFSEADMITKGYSYKDLTDVERRMQSVLEKTYKDWLYLVNYYDMDDDVLITMAAMYATFNFNSEFSQSTFFGESTMLYPQGLELKNFNYDAYMRLALLNSTGESVFATQDLYSTVLAKTSVFTGILLLACDILACIAIPFLKFVIIVGLLFLGILVTVSCVLTPPEKLLDTISKSILIPTVIFMILNIAFSYGTSIVVGEGLTAYVGSKSVNFATNDPTITMALMAILGVAYLFVGWKILKMMIDAYKQFGMATFMSAVGIVGSALSSGVRTISKVSGRAFGRAAGAAVGAATAEKGERLAGAYEGAHLGTGRVLDRRIRDKRMSEAMEKGMQGSKSVTDSINKKAGGSTETSDSVDSKQKLQSDLKAKGSIKHSEGKDKVSEKAQTIDTSKVKDTLTKAKTEAGEKLNKAGKKVSEVARNTKDGIGRKVDGLVNADRGAKIETSEQLHNNFKSGADAKMSGFDRTMSKAAHFMSKAEDTWSEVKHRGAHIGLSLREAKNQAGSTIRETASNIKQAGNQAYDKAAQTARNIKSGIEKAPENIKAGYDAANKKIRRTVGDIKAGAQLAGESIKEAPGRAKKYLNKGLETYKFERQYHKETSIKARNENRNAEYAERLKKINTYGTSKPRKVDKTFKK